MSIPSEKDIEMPLLQEIEIVGSEAKPLELQERSMTGSHYRCSKCGEIHHPLRMCPKDIGEQK